MTTTAAPFEKLSREELLTVVSELSITTLKLKHELDQLKRLVFGSKHERFAPSVAAEQLALGLNVEQSQPPEAIIQTVTYTRATAKKNKTLPTGRMKLPAHLPRERVVIEPAEDVTGLMSVGEEITEELDYTLGIFFVR